jgi:hypothetical protein
MPIRTLYSPSCVILANTLLKRMQPSLAFLLTDFTLQLIGCPVLKRKDHQRTMEDDVASIGAYGSLSNALEMQLHARGDGGHAQSSHGSGEPRAKKVKFNLLRNRVHMIPRSGKIIFDDIVCPADEEDNTAGWTGQEDMAQGRVLQNPIEIVIESPAQVCERELTERLSQFSLVKNMFDEGVTEEEPSARRIDDVFPRLDENPFIVQDRINKL